MATTVAQLITSLRIMANDTPTSNTVHGEVPQGDRSAGTNKNFYLQNFPIVSGSVYLNQNASFRVQAGFTVDLPNGTISFTAAPANTDKPFNVDYNFYWFSDVDHTDFVTEGTRVLGYAAADPTAVPDALISALLQFALFHFYTRRSAQYAHRYSSSSSMVGQSVAVVTKAFKDLADDAFKTGTMLMNNYYTRQGQREAPASAVGNYNIDPYTPKR